MAVNLIKNNIENVSGFTEKCQVFTKYRWKSVKDLTIHDKIATLNPFTRVAEFVAIKDLKVSDYTNTVLEPSQKHLRGLVYQFLPLQKLVVYTKDDPLPYFVRAIDVVKNCAHFIGIVHINRFKGKTTFSHTIKFKKQNRTVELKNRNLAYLLGFFCTKGFISTNRSKVVVKAKNIAVYTHIQDFFIKLNIIFYVYGNSIRIHSKSFWKYVYRMIGTNRFNRYVSDKIKALDSTLLTSFFDGLFFGLKNKELAFFNKKIIEDLMILLTKANIGFFLDNKGNQYLGKYKLICFEVLDKTFTKHKESPYSGKIYSIIVEPYHTLMVRFTEYSGYWTGDSSN